MTKKERELVEKIKQEMPEFTGTKVEKEKKVAMFIYLYLGKRKVFDEQYFLGNEKFKEKVHRKNRRINIDDIITKRKVVCLTLSTLYRRLLKLFDIKAENLSLDEKDKHVCNKIKLSDETSLIVDLQKDLSNIQTHSKTKSFGQDREYGLETSETLKEEEIFNLEKECGYIRSKEEYMDTKIEQLKSKIENLPPDELLQKVIEDKEVNSYQKDIGYIELFTYYSSLIYKMNPLYNKKDINYFNCYVIKTDENGDEYKDYNMCIYSIYKDEAKAYLYSKKEKRFIPTPLEKFDELERNGLYLGAHHNEYGVNLFRRYMYRACANKNNKFNNKKRNGEEKC